MSYEGVPDPNPKDSAALDAALEKLGEAVKNRAEQTPEYIEIQAGTLTIKYYQDDDYYRYEKNAVMTKFNIKDGKVENLTLTRPGTSNELRDDILRQQRIQTMQELVDNGTLNTK